MYSNRISTGARYNLLAADMKKAEEAFNRLTAQLASGKKFLSITEDPIAAVNIVNTNRQLGKIEKYNQNVEMAKTEINTMDEILSLATGYLSTAWDKAVQANNQTYSDDSLKALKVEIDEILKTMVDLGNTEFNDNYIFAGANTKQTPFVIDDNGNVVYRGTKQGSLYNRQYEVADGVYETINTTGDRVFGWYTAQVTDADGNKIYTDASGNEVVAKDDNNGNISYENTDGTPYTGDVTKLKAKEDYSGILGALSVLSNSIQDVLDGHANNDAELAQSGYEKMNSTLDMFKNALDTITAEQAKFGGISNRLDMTSNTLESNTENLTSYLSQLQEVDIAQAVSDWYQAQYAYQASMQVASASMNMSLLNYM